LECTGSLGGSLIRRHHLDRFYGERDSIPHLFSPQCGGTEWAEKRREHAVDGASLEDPWGSDWSSHSLHFFSTTLSLPYLKRGITQGQSAVSERDYIILGPRKSPSSLFTDWECYLPMMTSIVLNRMMSLNTWQNANLTYMDIRYRKFVRRWASTNFDRAISQLLWTLPWRDSKMRSTRRWSSGWGRSKVQVWSSSSTANILRNRKKKKEKKEKVSK